MSLLLLITFAYVACRFVPRLLVELVATVTGTWLVIANRRARATMLRLARTVGTATWEQKPSRAERSALRNGLAAMATATGTSHSMPTP